MSIYTVIPRTEAITDGGPASNARYVYRWSPLGRGINVALSRTDKGKAYADLFPLEGIDGFAYPINETFSHFIPEGVDFTSETNCYRVLTINLEKL